jgi:hypothetical protein
MVARIWIIVLACTATVGTSGCGSCRWHHRHAGLPYSCVTPFCDDPACQVCSPVPPLYDGWGMASFAGDCGSCGCGSCGTVISEGCPTGGCGEMMDGACGMPGGSCEMGGGPVCSHCQQSMSGSQATPEMFYSPPSEPMPTNAPAESTETAPPARYQGYPEAVPMKPPVDPSDSLAPEPPAVAPTFGIQPSEYYAPNKRSAEIPAPLTSTGPVNLSAPPALETSLQMRSIEQTSMRLPALP